MANFKSASVILAATATLLFLYTCHGFFDSPSYSRPKEEIMDHNNDSDRDLLAGLAVALRQSSSSSSSSSATDQQQQPPAITAQVTNHGAHPVTILTWDSPLDPLALARGLLTLHPVGAPAPLDLPTLQVSRQQPPGNESLVRLAPGESAANEIVLSERLVPRAALAGSSTVRVRMQGRWRRVWRAPEDGVLAPEPVAPLEGGDGVEGAFVSDEIEIRVAA